MVGLGETYVPAFVLASGLGEVLAGLITTIPVLLGSLLQLVSPWGGATATFASLARVVLCSTVQGVCFFPLMYAAITGQLTALGAILIATLYWGAGLATGPAWNTWQSGLVPRLLRANYYARRSRLQQLFTMLGFLGGGFALQWGRAHDYALLVFAMLFSIAGISRLLSVVCLWSQSEAEPPRVDCRHGSRWVAARQLVSGSTGALLLFAVSMQAAVYISGPFFNPYMLKVLQWDYQEYAIVLGASFVARCLTLPLWGRFAHRWGAWSLLWVGSLGLLPLSIGWNLSTAYGYLLVLQLLAGAAWAAYELALVLLFFDTIPRPHRTSILTLYNVANSVALVLGSMVGAALLRWGNLQPQAYHWAFAMSSLLRLVALGWLLPLPRLVAQVRMVLWTGGVRPNGVSVSWVQEALLVKPVRWAVATQMEGCSGETACESAANLQHIPETSADGMMTASEPMCAADALGCEELRPSSLTSEVTALPVRPSSLPPASKCA
ncbi:MAG: MFS transporter [Planctomycetaceae bacterium]|nr:MAG: MFS transporter [Planctomycetaceae bacterium]